MDILRFLKFGAVGLSGLIIDFSITWLCKEMLKINKYVANGIGFVFGVTNNYFLNRIFTFQNQDPNIGIQFLSFLLISIIGFGLNTGLLYFLQKKTILNFYACKIFVTIIISLWNFIANSFYTFHN
jgi:putative flippase GtrA